MTAPSFIFTPDAVPPLPIFCSSFVDNNSPMPTNMSERRVYVSGNIGCDKNFKLVEGGVQTQTRAALQNITIVLQAAGSSLKEVVKVNVYLTNMTRDFQLMNDVYFEFFEEGMMPARTCVGVAALPMGADVEIECTAEVSSTD